MNGIMCPVCLLWSRPSEVHRHFTESETVAMSGALAVNPPRLTHWTLGCGHHISASEWVLRMWPDGRIRFVDKGEAWN